MEPSTLEPIVSYRGGKDHVHVTIRVGAAQIAIDARYLSDLTLALINVYPPAMKAYDETHAAQAEAQAEATAEPQS